MNREPRARFWAGAAWAAAGAAVVVRLAFLYFYPVADDGNASYVQPALELLRSGRYDSVATLHRVPGAPLFFALCFALFGDKPLAAVVILHLAGIVGLVLSMEAARRAWGPRAAFLTGACLALEFRFPFHESFLVSEPVNHFYCFIALYLAARLLYDRSPAFWVWAAGGVAAALAALTKSEELFLAPLIAITLLGARFSRPRYIAPRLGLFLGMWALLIGGWAARNGALFGYWGLTPDSATVLLDSVGPLVRYDTPQEAVAKRIYKEQVLAREASNVDPRPSTIQRLENEQGYSYVRAHQALTAMAVEAIRSHPRQYLGLVRRNLVDNFLPVPWADKVHYERFPSIQAPPPRPRDALFWKVLAADQAWEWFLLFMSCLAPAAAFFFFSGRERWFAALLLCQYACHCFLLSLVRWPSFRNQAGLYIPLAFLAAFSLEGLLRFIVRMRASSLSTCAF